MHKHHIIPKHMGGSDDPSNLYECTVKEHAELHLSLYLEHGHLADWVAYHMISGQTEEGERSRRQLCSEQMQGNTRGSANKGRKAPWAVEINKKRAGTFIWITDGVHSKQHDKSKVIPTGWRKGRLMSSEAKKKMSTSAYKRYAK